MQNLYEDAIEFGAHPNQAGAGGSARIDKSGPEDDVIHVGVLTPGTLATAAALKASVEATIGFARTFRLIYPERCRIVGLSEDVDRLIGPSSALPDPAGSLRLAGLLRLSCGTGYLQHARPKCRIPAKKSVHRRSGTPRKPSQEEQCRAVQSVKALPVPTLFREVHGENSLVSDSSLARHALACSGRLRAGDHRSWTGHWC